MRASLLWLSIAALSACSGAECPAGTERGGAGMCVAVGVDAATSEDAGAADDAAPSDAAPSDAAPSDAAPSDAAPSDAAPSDAAPSDAGPSDAGEGDACTATTFWRDADGDGFGDDAMAMTACVAPAGFVEVGGDCDDARATAYPGATEACNGIDDDCNGAVDEGLLLTFFRDADGDGYGDASMTSAACAAPSGYVADDTDCNDSCATCRPGGVEICDGLDNDCDVDRRVDEGLQTTWYRDCDGDGHAAAMATSQLACAAPATTASCVAWTTRNPDPTADCDDSDSARYPGNLGWYTAPSGGSYDYDCSRMEELRYTDVGGRCSVSSGTCTRTRGWTSATAPACGASGTWLHDCAPVTCVPFTSARTQECH